MREILFKLKGQPGFERRQIEWYYSKEPNDCRKTMTDRELTPKEELLERFAYLDSKYGDSTYMDQEQYHIGYDEAILDYFKSVGMTEIAEKIEKARTKFWYA